MKREKESINFVLEESGLSSRSDYYLGSSIEYNDVTPEILVKVSNNIKKYIGEEEQTVFNQMILDLPTLKASFFIDFTIRLQIIGIEDGWWWNKKLISYYCEKTLPICPMTERTKTKFKKLMKI